MLAICLFNMVINLSVFAELISTMIFFLEKLLVVMLISSFPFFESFRTL